MNISKILGNNLAQTQTQTQTPTMSPYLNPTKSDYSALSDMNMPYNMVGRSSWTDLIKHIAGKLKENNIESKAYVFTKLASIYNTKAKDAGEK